MGDLPDVDEIVTHSSEILAVLRELDARNRVLVVGLYLLVLEELVVDLLYLAVDVVSLLPGLSFP